MSHNKGAAGRKMAWVVAFRTAESAVADVRGSCRIWSKASFQAAWRATAVSATAPSRSSAASKGGLAAAAVGDVVIRQCYQVRAMC